MLYKQMNTLLKVTKHAEDALVDPDLPGPNGAPAKGPVFPEAASATHCGLTKKIAILSLCINSDGVVNAYIPADNIFRRASGGGAVKMRVISASGGNYLSSGEFQASYPAIYPGVLTYGTKKGLHADNLVHNGQTVTLHIDTTSTGFDGNVTVMRDGVSEAVSASDVAAMLELRSLSTAAQDAKEPTRGTYEVLMEVEVAMQSTLPQELVCGDSETHAEIHLATRIIKAGMECKIGDIAEYIAGILSPELVDTEVVGVAIAEFVAQVEEPDDEDDPTTDEIVLDARVQGEAMLKALAQALEKLTAADVSTLSDAIAKLTNSPQGWSPRAAGQLLAEVVESVDTMDASDDDEDDAKAAHGGSIDSPGTLHRRYIEARDAYEASRPREDIRLRIDDHGGDQPVDDAIGWAGALSWLVPRGQAEISIFEIVDKLGGIELVRTVNRMRARDGLEITILTLYECQRLGDDLQIFLAVAMQTKALADVAASWDAQAATWGDAIERLTRTLDAAQTVAHKLKVTYNPGAHGGQGSSSDTLPELKWKPLFGTTMSLTLATGDKREAAVASAVGMGLATRTAFEAVATLEQSFEQCEAATGVPLGAITKLMKAWQMQPFGGLIRAVNCSNGTVISSMPGKGEIPIAPSGYANHITATVFVPRSQAKLGIVQASALKGRVLKHAASIWQGASELKDIVELDGAIAPSDHDDQRGARLGCLTGPTAPADYERGFKEYMQKLAVVTVDIGRAPAIVDAGGVDVLVQRLAVIDNDAMQAGMKDFLGRVARDFDGLRIDASKPMTDVIAICKAVEMGPLLRMQHEAAARSAAEVVASKFMAAYGTSPYHPPKPTVTPGAPTRTVGDVAAPIHAGTSRSRKRAVRAMRGVSPQQVLQRPAGSRPTGDGGPSAHNQRPRFDSHAPFNPFPPAMPQQQQATQQHAPQPRQGGGQGAAAATGPRRFTTADYPLTPNSLTAPLAMGRGPFGWVDAAEAHAAPGTRPCAFKHVLGYCNKQDCARCRSGDTFPSGVVAKIKAAMSPTATTPQGRF